MGNKLGIILLLPLVGRLLYLFFVWLQAHPFLINWIGVMDTTNVILAIVGIAVIVYGNE